MNSVARTFALLFLLTSSACLAAPEPAAALGAAAAPVSAATPAPTVAAAPSRATSGPQPTAYVHKASFGKAPAAPDRPAQPAMQYPPLYPDKWKEWGQPAYATVALIVNQYGKPEDPQCIEGTDRAFARAAEKATERWLFMPALKNQQGVRSLLTLRFDFQSPNSCSVRVVAQPAPAR